METNEINKQNKVMSSYVLIGVIIANCVGFIFYNCFGGKEMYNNYLNKNYIDAEHKIKFEKDSCSPFAICLVDDFNNNKKNWVFTCVNYRELYGIETKNIYSNGKISLQESNITPIYMCLPTTYGNEYINFSIRAEDSDIFNSISVNKYDMFYIKNAFYERYNAEKVQREAIENLIKKRQEERKAFVKDSIQRQELKLLHDRYYPNCTR